MPLVNACTLLQSLRRVPHPAYVTCLYIASCRYPRYPKHTLVIPCGLLTVDLIFLFPALVFPMISCCCCHPFPRSYRRISHLAM